MPQRRYELPTGSVAMALAAMVAALCQLQPAAAQEADGDGPAREQAPFAFDPGRFDASITVTGLSDYVSLRGYSQTDRNPAVQGTLDLSYDDFHVGFFTANVDFGTPEPRIEFDPFVAYRPSFGNWSLDLTYYYYVYFNDPDIDYPEFFNSLSYNFDDVATVTGTFAYAPDYFGAGETGYFYKGAVEVPLPKDFTLSGSLGWQGFEKNLYTEHFVWDAGIGYKLNDNVSFDLRYHDTDIAENISCVGAFQCGPTVVASVSINASLSDLSRRFGRD